MAPDPAASAALLARFGIRRPFVLHHGMVQLRKNVHRLIQAWDSLTEQNMSFDAQLVLAGPMGTGHEQILKVREASPNRDQIVLTGALSDAELATLVKNAVSVRYPISSTRVSAYLWWKRWPAGYPPWRQRLPVFPRFPAGSWSISILILSRKWRRPFELALEDSGVRNRLRDAGLARAAEFSWERCARETVRVFAETSAHHGQ